MTVLMVGGLGGASVETCDGAETILQTLARLTSPWKPFQTDTYLALWLSVGRYLIGQVGVLQWVAASCDTETLSYKRSNGERKSENTFR